MREIIAKLHALDTTGAAELDWNQLQQLAHPGKQPADNGSFVDVLKALLASYSCKHVLLSTLICIRIGSGESVGWREGVCVRERKRERERERERERVPENNAQG